MQGISSTSVFLNSSGYTSAKHLWWSHLLPPAQRHAVRFFNSWWIMERAFCISRSDHQSLPLSPPFPKSLVCGILRSTGWAHFQLSRPASGCPMLSEGRSAPFLVRHKFLSLKSKEVLTMKLSVAASKNRPKFCLQVNILIFPECDGMKWTLFFSFSLSLSRIDPGFFHQHGFSVFLTIIHLC